MTLLHVQQAFCQLVPQSHFFHAHVMSELSSLILFGCFWRCSQTSTSKIQLTLCFQWVLQSKASFQWCYNVCKNGLESLAVWHLLFVALSAFSRLSQLLFPVYSAFSKTQHFTVFRPVSLHLRSEVFLKLRRVPQQSAHSFSNLFMPKRKVTRSCQFKGCLLATFK